MTTMLSTERLALRPPAARDMEGACAFFQSDRAAYVGGPYSLGGAWRAFASLLGHWQIHGHGMWVVTRSDDDTCIGLVGSWCPADWPENEIGWLLWPNAEGKGYALEAARAALSHAFDVLGWTTAVSYIKPGNTRSSKLAERLGARLDPSAQQPHPEREVLIYRHPYPGGAA